MKRLSTGLWIGALVVGVAGVFVSVSRIVSEKTGGVLVSVAAALAIGSVAASLAAGLVIGWKGAQRTRQD